MDNGKKDFEKRLKGIEKKYKKSGRHKVVAQTGPVRTDNKGFAYSKKYKGSGGMGVFLRRAFSMLVLLFVVGLALRVFMSVQMGATAYDERVAELGSGSQSEQYMAMAMQRGPVMATVESFVAQIVNNASPAPADPVASPETTSVESNQASGN